MRANAVPEAVLRRIARIAFTGLAFLLLLVGRVALAAGEMPHGQGLLWKVERDGGQPSHLFGTIHITDERVLDLPPEVEQAFGAARSATFEVIMTDELRIKLARSMVLSDGRTLESILGPRLYGEAKAAGARHGFSAQQLKHFKPWALAMFLSVPQAELARSARGALPLDQRLQIEAAEQGKPVYALETGEEQIALFNGLAEADQIAMLESAIKDSAEIEALFETLTERYLARDTGGIYNDMLEHSGSMNKQLLDLFLLRFNEARNKTMVARMAERLEEGGAFIAVGALHLPGERGLLRLLEGRGYRVERVY